MIKKQVVSIREEKVLINIEELQQTCFYTPKYPDQSTLTVYFKSPQILFRKYLKIISKWEKRSGHLFFLFCRFSRREQTFPINSATASWEIKSKLNFYLLSRPIYTLNGQKGVNMWSSPFKVFSMVKGLFPMRSSPASWKIKS